MQTNYHVVTRLAENKGGRQRARVQVQLADGTVAEYEAKVSAPPLASSAGSGSHRVWGAQGLTSDGDLSVCTCVTHCGTLPVTSEVHNS